MTKQQSAKILGEAGSSRLSHPPANPARSRYVDAEGAALAAAIRLARTTATADTAISDMFQAAPVCETEIFPERPAQRIYREIPDAPVRVAENRRTRHRAVRVLIYSDEPILAAGLKSLIRSDPRLKLAACCRRLSEFKKALATGHADVAVVDFTEEITAASLAQIRALAADCKLILWTNAIAGEGAVRAVQFGICGVLRKSLPLEAHRQCLLRVNSGEFWFEKFSPEIVN